MYMPEYVYKGWEHGYCLGLSHSTLDFLKESNKEVSMERWKKDFCKPCSTDALEL